MNKVLVLTAAGGVLCSTLAKALAAATSHFKYTIKGDANLATIAEVEKLMSGNPSGRVVR